MLRPRQTAPRIPASRPGSSAPAVDLVVPPLSFSIPHGRCTSGLPEIQDPLPRGPSEPQVPHRTTVPRLTISPSRCLLRRALPFLAVPASRRSASGFHPRPDPPDQDRVPCVLWPARSEEHTSELQSHVNLVCRLLLEK